MQKDWDYQYKNGKFSIIKRVKVPEGAITLPEVWIFWRKRNIKTRKVKKYKAILNLYGSSIKPIRYYDETKIYSFVVKWNTIVLVFALVFLMGWSTTQIDHFVAFHQPPL